MKRLLGLMQVIFCLYGCGLSKVESNRDVVNESFLSQPEVWQTQRDYGLALAGGGTKASAFSMGVLKALADEDFLWDIDAISSVSGGSYSSYYLFSRLVQDVEKNRYSKSLTKRYFTDCFPDFYFNSDAPLFPKEVEQELLKIRCNLDSGHQKSLQKYVENYVHQQFIRCSQDVLKGDCDVNELRENDPYVGQVISILGAQVFSVIPGILSNTLFDWPINTSPSRQLYKDGIAKAYGFYPLSMAAVSGSKRSACEEGAFENCIIDDGEFKLDESGDISFSRMKEAYRKLQNENQKFPLWMLNATASPSRSLLGWLNKNQTDFSEYSFLMTPFKQGANRYGVIDLEANNVSVLDSVVSSAAFFDSSQTVTPQPFRFIAGVGLHAFNLNWGLDVPHPNAGQFRRSVRSLLPFPLYYADFLVNKKPAYVRLIDGGSTDNLGAYALVKNQFKNVIISDHAFDDKGTFDDVCLLRNEMIARHQRYLHIPGLKGINELCNTYQDRSMEHEGKIAGVNEKSIEHKYDIRKWKYPFLVGCFTDARDDSSCSSKVAQRIWIIKPAYDLDRVKNELAKNSSGKYVVKRCDTTTQFDRYKAFYPCEMMGYFAQKFDKNGEPPKFPQNTTVGMTLNSGPRLYGAYRELADYYMSHLVYAFKHSKDLFPELLEFQRINPIHPIGSKDFELKENRIDARQSATDNFYSKLYIN